MKARGKQFTKPRTFFHVVWDDEREQWCIEVGGQPIDYINGKRRPKERAVELATIRARELEVVKHPSEVVIHNQDGEIEDRRTHLDDPKGRG